MILPNYLPETYGGAEQQAQRLSSKLSTMGVMVTIMAPRLSWNTPAREIIAMSYGLPTIVSRVSGAKELVADGFSGWLFKPGSEKELCSLLCMAVQIESKIERAYGDAGRETVRARFSLDYVAKRNLTVYQAVMGLDV